MTFGLIGAGKVAQTLARHFVQHGRQVVFSNSKGPESLTEIAHRFGSNARAGAVKSVPIFPAPI